MSPDIVYNSSTLLFWTVLVIAARHDLADVSLLTALLPAYKRLLWKNISSPPHPVRSVQAMSLLCLWPLPTSSMSTDISLFLAGITKLAGAHIGIHRPELMQDFSRVKCQLTPQEVREAVKVWAGCYIASERCVETRSERITPRRLTLAV